MGTWSRPEIKKMFNSTDPMKTHSLISPEALNCTKNTDQNHQHRWLPFKKRVNKSPHVLFAAFLHLYWWHFSDYKMHSAGKPSCFNSSQFSNSKSTFPGAGTDIHYLWVCDFEWGWEQAVHLKINSSPYQYSFDFVNTRIQRWKSSK